MKNTAILLICCPDRRGLVASISDFVFRHDGNILHADEHGDAESGIFLMRVEFDPSQFDIPLADFAQHFSPIAEKFEMQWRLAQSSFRPKMERSAGLIAPVSSNIPFRSKTMTIRAVRQEERSDVTLRKRGAYASARFRFSIASSISPVFL